MHSVRTNGKWEMENLGDCLHPQFIIFHFPFTICHLSLHGGKPAEIRRIRINPRPMLSIGSTKLAAERMQAHQQVSRPFRMAQDEGKGAFIEGQVKAWSDPAPAANDRSDRPEQLLSRDRRINSRKAVAARDQELLARPSRLPYHSVSKQPAVKPKKHDLSRAHGCHVGPANCEYVPGPYGREHTAPGDLQAHLAERAHHFRGEAAPSRRPGIRGSVHA